MTDSIEIWVARLSSEPLPVLRRTLTRVRDLLNKTSTSHSALREAIEFDPGLTLHLFCQLENLRNQSKEPVAKLGNAIPLLGMGQIEQAIDELPALEDRLKGPPRRQLYQCYSTAAHAAIYASELAQQLKYREPESLANAALLHNIGEMALWNLAPDTMRKIQQLTEQGQTREACALQVLGFTLDELNQRLGNRWHLPKQVQESQALYNSYKPQALCVMLANALARESAHSWSSEELIDYQGLLGEFLQIPMQQAQARIHQYAALAARRLRVLPLPLPAFRLAYATAGENTQIVQEPESQEEPKPLETSAQVDDAKAKQPELEKKQQTDTKPTTHQNSLQETLSGKINEMKQHHGLENVMFAMLSVDKQNIIARIAETNEDRAELKNFKVSLQTPSLFSALMKKPQALWLHANNRHKYKKMIPQAISQLLCDRDMLLMSIFIKNKPIGLFYADNGCGAEKLTEHQYNNFKTLCRRFMQELA